MREPARRTAPDENVRRSRNNDICDGFCPSRETAPLKDKILEVAGLSEVFRVLSDETRTKIVYLLSHQELCVCDLAEALEMNLPAISHHLRLLKALRLVKYRRSGKMVFYSLDDQHIVNLIREARQHLAEGR
ncbi:MAG: metalloregulator ArsR/SmtB family transcription factor [Bacillota bacterium]